MITVRPKSRFAHSHLCSPAPGREPIDRKCRSNAYQSALDRKARNENIRDELRDQQRENARWVNCRGKWLSLLAALKVLASPRQDSSPMRELMFLLLAVVRRNLKKP